MMPFGPPQNWVGEPGQRVLHALLASGVVCGKGPQ
jgi:hypothetical protein